jgi:predicted nucleotidyltransferase
MKKPFVHKDYRKFYVETAIQKILEILIQFPEKEFSLSDLAKESKVSKAHMGGMLEELLKIEFIKIEKLNKIWRIKANQNNLDFMRSKINYNLNLIYQSGIIEFLNEYFKNPKAIILFGSFRKGEDISSSDIDIAIETDTARIHEVIELDEMTEFEKVMKRKIQIHLFNRKNMDINVFNNIANGIVLSGFLEVSL